MNYRDLLDGETRVVAVIRSEWDWRYASKTTESFDVLERRYDRWSGPTESLAPIVKPSILTVRDASEGGHRPDWNDSQRRDVFLEHLPTSTLVDIEVRSASRLTEVIEEARRINVGVILSSHYLKACPPSHLLRDEAFLAHKLGANLFKIAVFADTLAEALPILRFMTEAEEEFPQMPVVPMVTGKLGRAFRILAAGCKFPFVYGYVTEPDTPGQWHIADFKHVLAMVEKENWCGND